MNFQLTLQDSRRLFWLLHLGGWAAWGLIGKYFYTVAILKDAAPGYGLYVTLITLLGAFITLLLRELYRVVWTRPFWQRALAFAFGSYAASYVWISARAFIYGRWFEKGEEMKEWIARLGDLAKTYQSASDFEGQISSWVVMLAWSTLYFAFKYQGVYRAMRESSLRAQAMAHEAQLKMLRYQLNPHFLFNTLNAISTLILEQRTEVANRMVMRLSSFLRYSLDSDPMQRTTLDQEIEALKLYLDIEKLRFEERLQLEIDVQPDAGSALIPSLLLQPLVENAIKYAIAQSEDGGRLRIAARAFAGDLLIEVSDDGPGAQLVDGEIPDARGVGLRNTRERLRVLYGERHSFRLSPTLPHGLTVNIRIPCERDRKLP